MLNHLISIEVTAAGSTAFTSLAAGHRLLALASAAEMMIGLVLFLSMFSLLFLPVASAAPAHADTVQPSFLRSVESRSSNLAQFVRWSGVTSRAAEEAAQAQGAGCRRPGTASCRYEEWLQFLHTLRGLSRWDQLVAVNGYVNAWPYVPDEKNWGKDDHWATPGEFFARSGDCEDFAIAKFFSLKRLGWTDGELRITAVKDRKLGVGHAVLVVFLADTTWLLDNQLPHVTDLDTIRHYQPVFSINESHWWVHRTNERPGDLVLTVGARAAR